MKKFSIIILLLLFGQSALSQEKDWVETRGDYYGFGFAYWLPQNRNLAVGDRMAFCISSETKYGKISGAFNLDWIYNYTDQPMQVKRGSDIVYIKEYNGFQAMVEVGGEIWRKNKVMIES